MCVVFRVELASVLVEGVATAICPTGSSKTLTWLSSLDPDILDRCGFSFPCFCHGGVVDVGACYVLAAMDHV